MFSACIHRNINVFRDNQGMFGKVYFSRLTVPVSNIFICLIIFMVQMLPAVIMITVSALRGILHPLWCGWLLIIPIAFQFAMLGMGVGLLVSSVTAKYRDLSILISAFVSLWMYLSPVIYPLSQLENGSLRKLALINPITAPIELYRRILLGSGEVIPASLCFSFGVTIVVLITGIAVFNRVEQNFMDTV